MSLLHGVIRGKIIELDADAGLPDGEPVTVFVQRSLPPGEGIRQSACTGPKAAKSWTAGSRRSGRAENWIDRKVNDP